LLGLFDEPVPRGTTMIEEAFVGLENEIREPVVAQELPDVLNGVELGTFWRQGNESDVLRYGELGRQMPTGLIEQQRSMPARRNLFCDFSKMQVHRLSVAGGQNKRRALAVAWADGAKDIGRGSALIARRRGAGAAPCPTAGDLVLLADARLVGKPDFYVVGIDAFLLRDGRQLRGKTFLKSSIAASACS
jgi:hypothetical protein